MAPLSQRTRDLAARLEGADGYDLEVASARWVAPWLRELVLSGPLGALGAVPGQDLMVAVGADEEWLRWRRYTIAGFDADARRATLWVSTHSMGPGARWAAAAVPGDRVEAIGPRGKVRVDPRAAHHLFAVDDAGVAAMRAMAAAVPEGATASSLALAAPLDDAGAATAGWFDDVAGLLDAIPGALAGARGDGRAVHAYVFCELGLMRRVVARLAEEGLGADDVDAKPYWRADRPNEAHGEPDKSTPLGEPAR